MQVDGAATAAQEETVTAFANDEVTQQEVGSAPEFEFLGGVATVDKPVPVPDAHRGRITGVTSRTFDSGATALQIGLESVDEGFAETYSLFLPNGFVENINVDPTTLPTGELNEATGKIKGNQLVQYARTVRNSKGDAEIQSYLALAKEQGKALTSAPTDFDALVEQLNDVLGGIDVVFTRRAEGGDGPFADRLRVNRIVNINTAGNVKFHKKVRRAWEAA